MDIHNLQAYIEVADKKSFSRTAEALNLTQPAVSKRIAALEADLSSKLFDRMGRTVHLTEAGRVLLPSAIKINSEISRIEDEIYSLGSEVRGRLSIGIEERLAIDRLMPILKEFRDSYPDVVLDMQFTSTEDTLANLEGGVIDLGLCTIDANSQHDKSFARLLNIELWRDQVVIVVSSCHPLAALQSVSVAELAEFPAILPERDTALRKAIDRAMQDSGVAAKACMEMQSYPVCQSMVAIGLGWALLPESVSDESLVKLKLEGMNGESISFDHSVGVVRNPNRSLSKASKVFLDAFHKHS